MINMINMINMNIMININIMSNMDNMICSKTKTFGRTPDSELTAHDSGYLHYK